MIKAGIIGGAGYTAGELIRLLLNHPDVDLKWVHSTSNAGNPVAAVHQGLVGDTNLVFTSTTAFADVDVIFFCTPHGESRKFMEAHAAEIPEEMRIVDLSQDFRINDGSHDFIYGLPENQPQIHYPRQARCQPRMFRHSHSVGAASAGTQPAAQQRCPRACHHRLDGRGRETVAVVAFLMAQRQRVDLQAFQAPTLG